MIQIKNIAFSYGKKSVLKDITIHIKPGQIYGLLGENGVGKTTLLKIIAGLQKPAYGTCKVLGETPFNRLPLFLNSVFYLPENIDFLKSNVKIKDFAKENGSLYSNFSIKKLQLILDEFKIDSNAKFSMLSQGQLKKAFIAYGIATQTEILLLDEPTNGLDIPSKAIFRKIMLDYLSETTCAIISTHQVRDLENIIDPIIILDNESTLLNKSLEEITQRLTFTIESVENKEAFYSEPTLGGYMTVAKNLLNKETPVNLEALFNATIQNKELITELFNK